MVQLVGLKTSRKKNLSLVVLPAEQTISRRKNLLLVVPLVGLRINKIFHFQQSPVSLSALPEIFSNQSDTIGFYIDFYTESEETR